MNDIYRNIEEYNLIKKRKILIVSDDIITDMLSNKKLNPIVTKSLITGRFFVKHFSCFHCANLFFPTAKNIRLNFKHYFIRQIPTKQELQKIESNNSSEMSFMNLYKKCSAKPYSFLVINATLASDNLLGFRKDLLERI